MYPRLTEEKDVAKLQILQVEEVVRDAMRLMSG